MPLINEIQVRKELGGKLRETGIDGLLNADAQQENHSIPHNKEIRGKLKALTTLLH